MAVNVALDRILRVMNKLLEDQNFSAACKIARVSLIPKGKSEDKNFRSIYLLNYIGKLLEYLIRERLEEELEQKKGALRKPVRLQEEKIGGRRYHNVSEDGN